MQGVAYWKKGYTFVQSCGCSFIVLYQLLIEVTTGKARRTQNISFNLKKKDVATGKVPGKQHRPAQCFLPVVLYVY